MIGPPDGDFLRQFYPYRAFVADSWASGRLPVWNPHQYAGTPALADPQLAVLYPWRLLQAPLAIGAATLPLWAVELEVLGHVALAGWFVFLFVRRLGATSGAAFLAGCVFAYGGYLMGYPLEQLAILDTAVWAPATLWALTSALAVQGGQQVRWAIGAAVATTCLVLAGHPQTALYSLLLAIAWVPYCARRQGVPWPQTARILAIWLIGAACLSAPQWLPSALLIPRLAPRFAPQEVLAGLPVADAVQFLAPYVTSRWSPLYVGVPGVVLAIWASAAVPRARFWIVSAAVGWLVALGGHGPVAPLLVRLLPPAAFFRHQERAAMVVSLSLAAVVGLAVNALQKREPRAARLPAALLTGVGLGLLMGALVAIQPEMASKFLPDGFPGSVAGNVADDASRGLLADALTLSALWSLGAAVVVGLRARGRLTGSRLAGWLVLWTVLELLSLNPGRALVKRSAVFVPDEAVTVLRARAREGRVSSEAALPGGPVAASVYGLFDVTGDSPIRLATMAQLVESVPEMVWWRLLGVRFVVTRRTWSQPAPLRPLAESSSSRARLYEVLLPAPPVWLPMSWSTVSEWRPSAAFDPQAELVFISRAEHAAGATQAPRGQTAEWAMVVGASAASARRTDATAWARLTSLEVGRVAFEAELPVPRWVVLSMAYDPGWRVIARSAAGEVLRPSVVVAYGALPAIFLPAGHWVVNWSYWPDGLSLAAVLCSMALVGGGVLWRRSASGR